MCGLRASDEKQTLWSKATSEKLKQRPHLGLSVGNSTVSTLEEWLTQSPCKVKLGCVILLVSLSCWLDSTELSVRCQRESQLAPWSQCPMDMSVGAFFLFGIIVRRFNLLWAVPPWSWSFGALARENKSVNSVPPCFLLQAAALATFWWWWAVTCKMKLNPFSPCCFW